MEFPRLMYRPGTYWQTEFGRFDLRTADSAEHAQSLLPDGWRFDALEALEAAKPSEPAPVPKPAESQDDNAPPTRAELLQKAAELGIKTDGRWSDKRLAEAIAAKV